MTAGYDIVIVGAGSSGSVLAARLSEHPSCRVALVEAGGMPDDPDIADPLKWPLLQGRAFDWNYLTEPQPGTAGRRHSWPRGRIVGGSSCLHAMAHVRGHPNDFDAFAKAGGKRWSYDGLLPAFRTSESFADGVSELHGGEGPLDVILPQAQLSPLIRDYMAAARACGLPDRGDHNGREVVGTAPNSLTIRDGKRLSVADAYLTPALARPNLSLILGALADRIVFDRDRAVGVSVIRDDARTIVHGDRVVLAAGTIASPLILMRSGIGDDSELRRHGIACRDHRPSVGGNLHDHLLAFGNIYRAKKTVPPSRLQHSESLTYMHSDDPSRSIGAPDVVVGCATVPIFSDAFVPTAKPGEAYTIFCGVTHPTSRGRIALGGADPSAAPVIDPAYLATQADRDKFRASLRLARRIGQAPPLDAWREAELLPGPGCGSDADLDAFMARAASTHHHPVGTCRMGADAESVVDGDLRLRGSSNAFVVDASVFPAITSGPVNAAVVAVAETWVREIALRP